MGTINGHSRPVVGGVGKFADHTNVSCSGVPGRLWLCWGVPPAGPIICSGVGSTKSADCFSTPAAAFGFNDTAGILYGFTGVCHQAANRVLFAGNQTLNNLSKGYAISTALYGLYGISSQMLKVRWAFTGRFKSIVILNKLIRKGLVIDWITKLNTCVNLQGDLQPCLPPPGTPLPPPPAGLSPEESAYIEGVLALYNENKNWSEDDLYMESILLMLTQGLTADERLEYEIPLMQFFNTYLNTHADLTAAFIENEINTEQFVQKSNANILGTQEGLVGLLGPDQFKKGTGLEVGDFFQLIQPEIALETYGQEFAL